MKNLLFICFIIILGFNAKAQKKDWVNYPFREIFVDCALNEFFFERIPKCLFIQTENEYNNLCNGKKSEVNFDKEIVLGISVNLCDYQENPPYFNFYILQNTKTNKIYLRINYIKIHISNQSRSIQNRISAPKYRSETILTWIAIPKPRNDYEINVQFFNNFNIEYVQNLNSEKPKYPFRRILMDCNILQNVSSDSVLCYFVQTKEEFDFLCDELKVEDSIDFENEFILGMRVINPWTKKIPDFRNVTYNIKTGIIHITVFFDYKSTIKRKIKKQNEHLQSWYAIKKPEGDYEIHLHFVGWYEDVIKVFKNY